MAQNIRLNFADLFFENKLPELAAIIQTRADTAYASMIPLLFNMETMDKEIKQTTTISRTGALEERGESQPYAQHSLKPGFSKTFKARKFSLMLSISQEMVDDGKYNFINNSVEGLTRGCFETKERNAAGVFDNGFTQVGYDGVPLFSTQHPLENGSGVFGVNRPAVGSVLSLTSFRELRNILQDTLNEDGFPMNLRGRYFVCSQDDQDTAFELLKSTHDPQNANNAVNSVYEMLQLLPIGYWPYLTDNDAFFMTTDPMDNGLQFLTREELKIQTEYEINPGDYRIYADHRHDVGHSSWRGVVGNPGL